MKVQKAGRTDPGVRILTEPQLYLTDSSSIEEAELKDSGEDFQFSDISYRGSSVHSVCNLGL